MSLFIEIFLIGVGLSMDAFAVSICKGLSMKKIKKRDVFIIALFFGGFQALMPFIGWFLGKGFESYITSIDHWIAFAVFLALGLKVIDEALSGEDEPCKLSRQLTFKVLLMIGLATSIDALVTGITLYFMNVSIWFAAPAIGIITFVCAVIGFQLNCCFKKVPTRYLEIAAGIILILLGCKVLYEHLSAE